MKDSFSTRREPSSSVIRIATSDDGLGNEIKPQQIRKYSNLTTDKFYTVIVSSKVDLQGRFQCRMEISIIQLFEDAGNNKISLRRWDLATEVRGFYGQV